jgi:nitrogen-specific signal transduction histidine kinase
VDSLVKNTGGRLETRSDERRATFSISLPPK